MKKKILFVVSNFFFNKIYLEIINELEKCGFKIEVLTNCNDIFNYFKIKQKRIINLNDVKIKESPNLFKEYIQKYELNNLNYFANREINVYKRDPIYLKRQIVKYFYFMESYLKINKGRLFAIANNDHNLINLVIDKFCKKTNTPVLHKHGMSIRANRMLWDPSLNFDSWVKNKKTPLKEREKKEVKRYIKQIKNKKPLVGFNPISPNIKRIKKYWRYLKHYILCGKSRKEFISPINLLCKWASIPFKKTITKVYYSQFKKDSKYIYFPLNMWDDSAIACNSPNYFLQHKVVKDIANKLPENLTLIVKEHPVMVGSTPLTWLRTINKTEKVKLVPPSTNSHDIIKNAKAVIIISSSVGWETLIWNKPLIILGNTFYSGLNTITKANISNLYKKIKESQNKTIDFNEVEKFIFSALHSDYPCYIFNPQMEFNINKENVKKIASSFIDAINYYYKN